MVSGQFSSSAAGDRGHEHCSGAVRSPPRHGQEASAGTTRLAHRRVGHLRSREGRNAGALLAPGASGTPRLGSVGTPQAPGAQRPDRPADGVGLALLEARRRADLIERAAGRGPGTAPRRRRPSRWPRRRSRRAPRRPRRASARPPRAVAAVAVEPPVARRSTRRRSRPSRRCRGVRPQAGQKRPAGRRARGRPRGGRAGRRLAGAARRAAALAATSARTGAAGRLGSRGERHARPRAKTRRGQGPVARHLPIPSEVALVEYGRGCRIHRVVIETAADSLVESF